jgi:hypothetical protein
MTQLEQYVDKVVKAFQNRRIPIKKEEVSLIAEVRTMKYNHDFICKCGAMLKIKAKENRKDGPSNFKANAFGHATLPSHELTWYGLVEERGWKVKGDKVTCPACQVGMTVLEYKASKRQ